MDDRPDGDRSRVTAALDGFVTPTRVIVNMGRVQVIQKALVELQDVPQMRPGPMRREAGYSCGIDGVVEPIQEAKGLTQPANIGRDECGLTLVKGRCRLHAAHISASRPLLFPGIFRVRSVLKSHASRDASRFKPLRS